MRELPTGRGGNSRRVQSPRQVRQQDEAATRVVGGTLGGILLGAALVGTGPAALVFGAVGMLLASARNAEISGERKPRGRR